MSSAGLPTPSGGNPDRPAAAAEEVPGELRAGTVAAAEVVAAGMVGTTHHRPTRAVVAAAVATRARPGVSEEAGAPVGETGRAISSAARRAPPRDTMPGAEEGIITMEGMREVDGATGVPGAAEGRAHRGRTRLARAADRRPVIHGMRVPGLGQQAGVDQSCRNDFSLGSSALF